MTKTKTKDKTATESLEKVVDLEIERARYRGVLEGLQDGMSIGRKDEQLKIIKNLLAAGASVELISTVTELSSNEIQNLKTND